MKKFILSALMLVAFTGCLATQNRKINMKSPASGGVSSVNSAAVVEVNPKDDFDKDVEYFETHSVKWPDKKETSCNEGQSSPPSTEKSAPKVEPKNPEKKNSEKKDSENSDRKLF